MPIQLAMFGVWELIVILAIILLISGAGKLPMLGESLGKGISSFRKSLKDEFKEVGGQVQLDERDQALQLRGAQALDQVREEKDKPERP